MEKTLRIQVITTVEQVNKGNREGVKNRMVALFNGMEAIWVLSCLVAWQGCPTNCGITSVVTWKTWTLPPHGIATISASMSAQSLPKFQFTNPQYSFRPATTSSSSAAYPFQKKASASGSLSVVVPLLRRLLYYVYIQSFPLLLGVDINRLFVCNRWQENLLQYPNISNSGSYHQQIRSSWGTIRLLNYIGDLNLSTFNSLCKHLDFANWNVN